MTYGFRRNNARHCSRCGLPLEDPASEQRGVGPICAKKDTVLFARTIQANYAVATALMLGVKVELLPEGVLPRWEAVKTSVLKHASKAAQRDGDFMAIHLGGEDLRGVVKELDWMLSHRLDSEVRNMLVRMVHSLGYVELAGVLSMEASTTPASLWFHQGRVFLKGKSNKSGWFAMRGVPGIEGPRRRGDETPYSAPASQVEAFLNVVQAFWPFYELTAPEGTEPIPGRNLDNLRSEAKEWKDPEVRPEAPVASKPLPEAPRATLSTHPNPTYGRLSGTIVRAEFPWLKDKSNGMYALVAAIKDAIPYVDRSYDAVSKSWYFLGKYEPKVTEILSALFQINRL